MIHPLRENKGDSLFIFCRFQVVRDKRLLYRLLQDYSSVWNGDACRRECLSFRVLFLSEVPPEILCRGQILLDKQQNPLRRRLWGDDGLWKTRYQEIYCVSDHMQSFPHTEHCAVQSSGGRHRVIAGHASVAKPLFHGFIFRILCVFLVPFNFLRHNSMSYCHQSCMQLITISYFQFSCYL